MAEKVTMNFSKRDVDLAENERDFKGVWISKEVWLDERLNALEKIILTEIDSLDSSERGCFASNAHIAEFCQCSETKVSTAVSKLLRLGYLTISFFDGRQRLIKSNLKERACQDCKLSFQKMKGRLSKNERQTFKICKADFQNLKESNKDNNTVNNKDSMSIGEETKRKRFSAPTLEDVKAYCTERNNNVDPQRFIDYYTANGWKIGKNTMKDWKAAVRTWENNGYDSKAKTYISHGLKVSIPEEGEEDDLAGIL